MDWDKQLHQLTERLNYVRDIFAGKHQEDIGLLDKRLAELKRGIEDGTVANSKEGLSTLEDLFFFMECKLEDRLTPMDKVRIVRHPQRICLRDILENVYDNYTEIGGQDEHTNDPAMLIARAYITRRRGKKVFNQSVLVIGHEKGHGEEFRNGGAAKPWGNAKALHYMQVAETEGIPVHAYVFTPGGDPVEDYPGAAQQIARNIYEMAGLEVPVVAVFSEGGSGGAEAIALADKLEGHAKWLKIGMTLYYAEGPAIVKMFKRRGFNVFLDLKFHDIPHQVQGAARSAAASGADMLTMHTVGGTAMMEAGQRGAEEGAAEYGGDVPATLGITVLTSMSPEALAATGVARPLPEQVAALAAQAKEAGISGVVASPQEAAALREILGPDAFIVTPGVRPAGAALGDQSRVATPAQAFANGASHIVVGRPITEAPDPVAAFEAIAAELE